MNRYTIFCTVEQTKKALELGAPIDMFTEDFDPRDILPEGCEPIFINKREQTTHFQYWLVSPTAEQMIGWLEEKDIIVKIVKCDTRWFARPCSCKNADFNKDGYSSRKEATLTAIDSALNYLIQMKGGDND